MNSADANDAEYARLLREDPLHPDLWQLRARLALRQQCHADAAELLKEGLKHLPAHAALMADLANLYLQLRDSVSARPVVEQLLGLEGQNPEYILSYARLLWLEGDYKQALACFQKASARDPDNGRLALRTAQAQISLGQTREAMQTLHTWQHKTPPPEMLALLALCTFDESGMDEARDILANGLRTHPLHPTISYLYAVLLMLSGETDKAKACIGTVQQDEKFQSRWAGFLFAYESGGTPRFCGLNSTLLKFAMTQAPATGLVLEFGVYHGLSLRQLACLTDGPVHGFDSFQGLPEDWTPGEPAGSYSAHGRLPPVPAHVVLHPGWFQDTLPAFVASQTEKVRFVHIDCDLYSSAWTVLKEIYPHLQIGTVLVFDEYLGFPGYEQHEFQAWREFSEQFRIGYEYIGFTLMVKKAVLRITKL